MNKKKARIGALVAGIPLLGFTLFGLIPLVFSVVLSFFELHTSIFTQMKWVGFGNFIEILRDEEERYYYAYLTTAVYMLSVPIGIGAGLYIAQLLDKVRIMKRFFRSLFFIPFVCSSVVTALTFKILFRNDGGVLNSLLETLGYERVEWLSSSPVLFLGVVIFMTTWSGLGFTIVLYSAALSSVDRSYYEAAKVDGATPFQIFWRITWPAITPTTSYLLTMRLIGAMQVMAELYVLVSGPGVRVPTWGDGVGYVSNSVTQYIYDAIFTRPFVEGFGYGSAAGWMFAFVIIIVTQINLKLQKRWVCYDFG